MPQSAFNGPRNIVLLSSGDRLSIHSRTAVILRYVCLALASLFLVAKVVVPCAGAEDKARSVSVARRDLRPLAGVTLQLAGTVTVQGVTDENGRAAFPGLPAAGVITMTPSRSGFRFEPPQLTIADLGNLPVAAFTAFATSTDV